MRVFRNVNSVLNSNTYILCDDYEAGVYVIDPGDSAPIFEWLISNKKSLAGIILTHTHYDHIFGVNDLLDSYPDSLLYVDNLMHEGLFSVKLNTSLYHEKPYVLKKQFDQNFVFLEERVKYPLWNSVYFSIISTPGHTKDCISINIEKYLFCGDALIPGLKVYKVKGSDPIAIVNSIERICTTFPEDTLLMPGHGAGCLLSDLRAVKEFNRLDYSAKFSEI